MTLLFSFASMLTSTCFHDLFKLGGIGPFFLSTIMLHWGIGPRLFLLTISKLFEKELFLFLHESTCLFTSWTRHWMNLGSCKEIKKVQKNPKLRLQTAKNFGHHLNKILTTHMLGLSWNHVKNIPARFLGC